MHKRMQIVKFPINVLKDKQYCKDYHNNKLEQIKEDMGRVALICETEWRNAYARKIANS